MPFDDKPRGTTPWHAIAAVWALGRDNGSGRREVVRSLESQHTVVLDPNAQRRRHQEPPRMVFYQPEADE